MNPEIKQKWLEALKSGQYQKGKSWLKQNVMGVIQYCCLGVLCELYKESTGKGEWRGGDKRELIFYPNEKISDSSDSVLPIAVRQWADIGDGNGIFIPNEEDKKKVSKLLPKIIAEESTLTCLNDRGPSEDFSDVIPFIEKYF